MEELNNKNNKSRKLISVILLILILLVLIGGTSYAAWRYNFIGTLTNTITTPDVSLDFLESNTEIINITNALSMSDNEGKAQTETFDFAVTSKTSQTMIIGYNLFIEKLEVDTGYTALNDNDIKIYLTDYNDNELLEPTLISDLSNYKFYSNIHNHDATHVTIQDKFKLRAWIAPDNVNPFEWNQNTKLQYKFKIGLRSTETVPFVVNAVAVNGTISGNTSAQVADGGRANFTVTPTDSSSEGIVSCTNNQTGTYSNNKLIVKNVTSNTTCTVTFTPASTVLYTDGTLIINEKPSDRQSNITTHGAVTNQYAPLSNQNAYVFNTDTSQPWDSNKTSVTSVEIGQKIEPIDTKYWFYGLINMATGDFTNLDTKNVVSMQRMFDSTGNDSSVSSFVLLGLSDWDTTNVENMRNMFDGAGARATTWNIGNISGWDVSNVTDMKAMFEGAGYSATTFNIDLSNWDTSSVIDMSYMFNNAGRNSTTFNLNLLNWDTGEVISMRSMFYFAGRYVNQNFNIEGLSSWNVSSVTSMREMFNAAGCDATNWSIGDLSNWDTSSVTNMSTMFSSAGRNATTWSSIGTLKVYATDITNMFLYCEKAKATFNIYSNPTSYSSAFANAATASDALITVNYSSATTNIDDIIATGSGGNVVKGVQLD